MRSGLSPFESRLPPDSTCNADIIGYSVLQTPTLGVEAKTHQHIEAHHHQF
jgi:hypothetical protein